MSPDGKDLDVWGKTYLTESWCFWRLGKAHQAEIYPWRRGRCHEFHCVNVRRCQKLTPTNVEMNSCPRAHAEGQGEGEWEKTKGFFSVQHFPVVLFFSGKEIARNQSQMRRWLPEFSHRIIKQEKMSDSSWMSTYP